MSERELFVAALHLTDPVARAAFLDQACGADRSLRDRIDSLLGEHDKMGSFLEAPAGDSADPSATATFGADPAGPAADDPGKDEQAGTVIAGKYTLVEVIGEGGMGSVWRAKQSEPVKRYVAVKLIKAGMDSRQVLARFEAERQALALMDYPNIAKVLDGGLHDGRPFFVMELVKGVPITEFCDARKLTPKERLELFVPVCQAIRHAHQKGIIHRDIKPSNVLIALYDDRPVVKVIDFGVAKATGAALTEHTIDTGFGAVVGTPQYMSPEQATFNNLDIDTRSDVYALGVLLYELLTGSPPFTKQELEKRGVLEMLRVVREEEPPRPSTRLSTADALPTLSANRGTEPKKLAGLLRNELDWIVMKALEKDRTRRYDTANALSRDIQRYLADEVVEARPPSVGYRVSKFVRRHKGQVIAAVLVVLALLAGITGTTFGLFRAEAARRDEARQRATAEKAAEAERLAKLDADTKRQEAETNLAFARKGNAILGSVFAGLDPKANYATVADLRNALRDNLNKAVKELEGSAIGEPLEVAAMQNTLGESLLGLGEASLAVEVHNKALATRKAKLGPDHPDTLVSMNNLAVAYQASGQLGKAMTLLVETLEKMKAKLGPDHRETLNSMNSLAQAFRDSGQPAKALALFEETLEKMKAKLGPDHPTTLATMDNLAGAYQDSGQLPKAVPLFEAALEKRRAKLGPDHPDTLTSMHNLALAYELSGQLAKALALFEETLEKEKAKLGPDHPSTLISMSRLAGAYQDSGQLARAVALYEEALEKQKAKLGPDHPDTLTSMSNLAVAYEASDQLAKALALYEETLEKKKAKLGPDHPETLISMNNLAVAYRDRGQPEKAVPLLEATLEKTKAKLGAEHPQTLMTMSNLGSVLLRQKKWADAEPVLRDCLAGRQKQIPDSWRTFYVQSLLGGALLGQKKYAEAEPLLVKGYEGMKAREKTIPKAAGWELRIPEALDRLIELYTAINKADEAKKWQAERAKYPEAKKTVAPKMK
jgi:serine/threonine protein kinase